MFTICKNSVKICFKRGDYMSIGDTIKKYRIHKKLTQQELSVELNKANINVGASTISNWENGVSNPDLNAIIELCKILEIDGNIFLNLENIKEIDINKVLKDYFDFRQEQLNKVLEYIDFIKNKG